MTMQRRRFLSLSVPVTLSLMGVARTGMAAWLDTQSLDVTDHVVPVRRLEASADSLLVAHLTDLHLHVLTSLHEAIITTVRERNPALIVLTGDIINSERRFALLAEFCRQLAAPERTIVATLGNHERYGRIPLSRIRALYRQNGVQLLHNEAVHLPSGLTIVGVGDHTTRQDNCRQALQGLPPRQPYLFLTHAPRLLDKLPLHVPAFALALCGHTHGGQICVGPRRQPVVRNSGRFVAGFYETSCGPAYVSRGLGTTLLPLRLNCPPELPFFRLVRA